MKPSNGKNIILSAFCILLAAILLLLTAAVWNIIPSDDAMAIAGFLTGANIFARIFIGAVFLLLAAGVCFAVFHRRKTDTNDRSALNLLEKSEAGSAYISSAAIDSIVQRCVKKNQFVKSCASAVRAAETGGMLVELKLVVMADCNIPTLCAELRRVVKNDVESVTGMNVADVSCAVVGIAAAPAVQEKKRVN